ncbi:MAG: TolC family protein [Alphaproteobacteria bacterium]|nr:TolC family protein [Alphaproteobacteria bacterium]
MSPSPPIVRVLLAAALALQGCVGRHAVQREDVALALASRTGHPLRDAPGAAELPDGVDLGDGLDADEAVALALWNDPAFEVTLAQLGYARADLVEAGLLKNPTLSLLFPLGPRQWQAALSLPVDALWILPKRVEAARRRSESTGERLVQGGLDLVRDTRVAFARAVAAEARVVHLDALAATQQERLDLEIARVRWGDAAERDVDPLRSQTLQRQTERDLAQMALAEARATLRRWVRVELPSTLAPPVLPAAVPDASDLWTRARAWRPDLRAAELDVAAAEAAVEVARRSAIAAAVGLEARGGNASPANGGVTASVTLPVFDWNQAGMVRARTDLDAAHARVRATEARIEDEIRLALARWQGAQRTLRALTADRLPALEAALDRVQEAHRMGDVSGIEVALAREDWHRARLAAVDAELAMAEAAAELARAVGGAIEGEGS